jgi:filamentous hemagglutinin family protein
MGRAWPPVHIAPALLLALTGVAAPPASAQNQGLVVRDGTLGSAPAGVVAPGPDDLGQAADYLIRADLGEQHGRNLFHSFLRFSIGSGERATFTDQGAPNPGAIENVISRVTGPFVSEIGGTLHSTIPGADVWLLNPNGVVFGEGAQLDVPGSFHAGTGDYVGFEGGLERFYGDPSRPSVLATAAPAAFGFLPETNHPASLAVDRSRLEVPEGETLELVSGDLSITGGELLAPGGHVGLEAQGEVALSQSLVDVGREGDTPGSISLRGGQIVVQEGSQILAENTSPVAPPEPHQDEPGPGRIEIAAGESVLVDDGLLSVSTHGAGNAGTIRIAGLGPDHPQPDVTFRNGPGYANPSGVNSTPEESARGARAETAPLHEGEISSGRGGRIVIDAGALTVTNGVALSALAVGPGATGDAGHIAISASSMELSDRSFIGASGWRSPGDGGTVVITLRGGGLTLDGEARDHRTPYAWLFTQSDFGNPGTIEIRGGPVDVRRNGLIFSGGGGPGPVGGAIRIGTAGEPVASVTISDGGAIDVHTHGEGNAGTVEVHAGSVVIGGGGRINAATRGRGNAGTVEVHAGSVVIGGGGRINAETRGSGTPDEKAGDAGDIKLVVDSLEIQTGGAITTSSIFGGVYGGDAGDIDVTASGWISMTNVGGDRFDLNGVLAGTTSLSGIFSATVGSGGAGGSIRLAAPEITVTEGAIVASSTIGGGVGGTVELSGDRIRIANGGFLDTTTAPLTLPVFAPGGPAGDVTLDATQWIEVGGTNEDGPSLVASRSLVGQPGVPGGTHLGDAGEVTLKAPSIRLFDGGWVTTNADQANGGDITIHAQKLVHLDAGLITSSVNGETGGNITIDPTFVILENRSRIEATASGIEGRGGRIRIATESFFQFPGSRVSAEAARPEFSGTVEVHSPDVDLAGTLTPLPSTFLDAALLMRERCAARRSGERAGSFSVRGSGGIASEPDGWLRAPVLLEPPATPSAAAPGPSALVASLPGPLLGHGNCP